jgi:alginate O-acetyltransferase complex protein AlgI
MSPPPSTSETVSARWIELAEGMARLGFGLAKMVLLAQTILPMARAATDAGDGSLSTFCAWLGLIAGTLGITFAFSGLADVLAGLARMIGWHLRDDFTGPCHAASVTEFWQRWALPGTAEWKPTARTAFSMICLIAAVALWHGFYLLNAAAWVVLHLLLLAWERWSVAHRWISRLPRPLRTVLTLCLTASSWVILATVSLDHAIRYFGALFGQVSIYETAMLVQLRMTGDLQLIALVIAACIAWLATPTNQWLRVTTVKKATAAVLLLALAVVVASMNHGGN